MKVNIVSSVEEKEIKIVFKEGEEVRVLRGKKVLEDDIFIVLQRNDGRFWINKNSIIKIEDNMVDHSTISFINLPLVSLGCFLTHIEPSIDISFKTPCSIFQMVMGLVSIKNFCCSLSAAFLFSISFLCVMSYHK